MTITMRFRLLESRTFGDTDISLSEDKETGWYVVHWNVDIEECNTHQDCQNGKAGWESWPTEEEARSAWREAWRSLGLSVDLLDDASGQTSDTEHAEWLCSASDKEILAWAAQ